MMSLEQDTIARRTIVEIAYINFLIIVIIASYRLFQFGSSKVKRPAVYYYFAAEPSVAVDKER
jgi:hypothetical protein